MDLSTFPLVVLDRILLNLTLRSLLSISRTCKALHIQANRLLYRHPGNIFRGIERQRSVRGALRSSRYGSFESRMEKLEASLSAKRANARFLRIHTSYNPRLLQAIWSLLPVALIRLHLDVSWFTRSNEKEIGDCITSKHPETVVEELSVAGPPSKNFCGLLGRLDSFRGLNTLQLQLSSPKLTLHPDDVIAQLKCPLLKRLVLRCSSHLVSLGDRLPSLESLEIYPLYFEWIYVDDEEENCESPNEKWAKLLALKERGIKFVHAPLLNNEIGLLSFVYQHAERKQLDPAPIARWLITCRNHFQRIPKREISLRRFSLAHRDAALWTIRALSLEEFQLEIRLHHHDTTCIAHSLPEMITSLKLVISKYNHISPAIIPEIIQSLPKLRALSVHLYMGCLEPGQLVCNATCFGSDVDFPIVATKHKPQDLEFACQYQLQIVRGMVQIWRMASECDESGEPIFVETEIGIRGLEIEVGEWLKRNAVLDSITMCFDGESELFEYY